MTIRNVAIIAHVDHGKTTLVDTLLRASQTFESHKIMGTRVMDSNQLEQERGITILAKNTAIDWQGVRINIVDTPGHADFGGEVERVLSMVDAVLLVVDAVEGPMPQTRFVTQKAFSYHLKPLVVVNKMDRPGARPDWVVDQLFALFDRLGGTDEQLDFTTVYASALSGYATLDPAIASSDMAPLLNAILKLPAPKISGTSLQLQISMLDYSNYIGTIGIGRIHRGSVHTASTVSVVDASGGIRTGKVTHVMRYQGLERVTLDAVHAGDLVAIAGLESLEIGDTVCDVNHIEALPPLRVDEPMVTMTFQVNTSPLSGQDGQYITSRQLQTRLDKELRHNVALRVAQGEQADQWRVSGRGELHLSILIETLRREGFEFAVSKPEVVFKTIDGVLCEPYECVFLDVEHAHQGVVMDVMGQRKGTLKSLNPDDERVHLEYSLSTRCLMGFRALLLTLTSGTGIMNTLFDAYRPATGDVTKRANGVLISTNDGQTTGYALWQLQDRGAFFIWPGTTVYEGMIVGLHNRNNDLMVNATRPKALTNVRASGSDEHITLTPYLQWSLESLLNFLNFDELLEVTPSALRLRKRYLKEHERKKKQS
jgi:GTP-binding protein